jgi:hypothetical protein
MPELGPYGSVRGARGNSRPYRESDRRSAEVTRLTQMEGQRSSSHLVRMSRVGAEMQFTKERINLSVWTSTAPSLRM